MVVAHLAPMDAERAHFTRWLESGYQAGMEYLKRNPHFRTSPALLFPQATSAIVVSVSYYTEAPEAPDFAYGRVARYAVGLDYHAVLRARLRELKARIEEAIGRSLLGKAFTDDVALYEQGLAARHGLGFAGRNTMIIGPGLMGSFNFVAELFTDLDIEADEPYEGTCGKCFRCGAGCPTDAIKYGAGVDSNLCISYLTIENKDGIPVELRAKLGSWVFGCDVCQDVCPYNQRPQTSPWPEFQPDRGVGHYLRLADVLSIKDEEHFRAVFGHTPLRRPRRRGMLRNAIVVAGNQLANGLSQKAATALRDALSDVAAREEDPMLQEHAAWALAQ
jgi:epoxyqueuosine reductase